MCAPASIGVLMTQKIRTSHYGYEFSIRTYRHFFNGSFYFIRRDQYDPRIWNVSTYFVPPEEDVFGIDWHEIEEKKATRIHSDETLKACTAFAKKHAASRLVTLAKQTTKRIEKLQDKALQLEIQGQLEPEEESQPSKKRSDFEAFVILSSLIGMAVFAMSVLA